jgi:hypothetical protein
VATEHDLYQTMAKFDVFTESEWLQVKVPIAFLVTACFSRQKGDVISAVNRALIYVWR